MSEHGSLGQGGSWRDLAEVQTALSCASATVLRRNAAYQPRYSMEWLSRASGLRIHHARPVVVNSQVQGVILTSRSPRALFKGIYQNRGKILFGIVAVLGLLSVLAVVVSPGIARPIEVLRRAARDVTHGGGVIRPPPPPTASVEIRDLYEDFGQMAEAVDRRSRYFRDFAAAVSHEFKTPLAGIQGAVELLQDHGDDMEPHQRRRFIAQKRAPPTSSRGAADSALVLWMPSLGQIRQRDELIIRACREHIDAFQSGARLAGRCVCGSDSVFSPARQITND